MAQDKSWNFDIALHRWMERNKWGATVFAVGAPITYWLAREQSGPMGQFIAQLQHQQLSATVIGLLIGAMAGGCGVLALWLLRRRRDVAIALIGLAGLYISMTPGVGYFMPAVSLVTGFGIGAAILTGLLYSKKRKATSVTFGSAAWADCGHLLHGGLLNNSGLYLGRYPSSGPNGDGYLTY
jgi:hypothetical protein